MALINARIDAGDNVLKEHLEACGRNATYVSKTSQNELSECIKVNIQNVIVQQIKDSGGFYGIQADEVTDVSNWEQLGLVVRYVHDGKAVERFVDYIKCSKLQGC